MDFVFVSLFFNSEMNRLFLFLSFLFSFLFLLFFSMISLSSSSFLDVNNVLFFRIRDLTTLMSLLLQTPPSLVSLVWPILHYWQSICDFFVISSRCDIVILLEWPVIMSVCTYHLGKPMISKPHPQLTEPSQKLIEPIHHTTELVQWLYGVTFIVILEYIQLSTTQGPSLSRYTGQWKSREKVVPIIHGRTED